MLGTRLLLAGAVASVLAVSGGGGGGGGGDSASTGLVSIAVTDTPADEGIAEIWIQFTALEFQSAGGERHVFTFDPPRDIDLWALQDGLSEELIREEPLPAGRFTWIRLDVNAEEGVRDSYVRFESGEEYPLYIPSNAQAGLKLVRTFDLPVNGHADFMIDWDLAKSVHCPSGQVEDGAQQCFLRPALRLVDRSVSGEIWGTVDPELVFQDETDVERCAEAGGNRVYLFEKPGVEAILEDDIDLLTDDGRAEVLATARVRHDLDTDRWRFDFAFVAPGEYTVAFTCSATEDSPEEDDYPDIDGSSFDFESRGDVSVTDSERTIVEL